MGKVVLTAYTPDRLADYQAFALKNWGDTYQAKPEYTDWLYNRIPAKNKKPEDFTLAIDSETNKIIGVIHKMRLSWRVGTTIVDIPAIHNLIVDKDHRTGNGLFLITGSLKGDEHIFVPGVLPPLSGAYDALRCQEIPVSWYRKIIVPNIFFNHNNQNNINYKNISDLLNKQRSAYYAAPQWTPELVQWRFFDPVGPKNILVQDKESTDFLILSIGPRKGILISRIVEGIMSPQSAKRLMSIAKQVLHKHGVYILFGFCADPELNQALQSINWKPFKSKAKTYIYHKDRKPFDSYAFNACVGDFGFEGLSLNNSRTL